jgi:hypothetical protein
MNRRKLNAARRVSAEREEEFMSATEDNVTTTPDIARIEQFIAEHEAKEQL